MFIYSGCKGVVPFLIHKQCEEAKCYLMFPERNLRDLRSNSWFRMGRTVTKQEKSLDENAFHISSVRATVVIT